MYAIIQAFISGKKGNEEKEKSQKINEEQYAKMLNKELEDASYT